MNKQCLECVLAPADVGMQYAASRPLSIIVRCKKDLSSVDFDPELSTQPHRRSVMHTESYGIP
jgi:hypothetical protein